MISMKMSLKDLYEIYLNSDGVEIDSRKIQSNKLFFALKGENVNGHHFVKSLTEKEDVYSIIDDEAFYINSKTILVDNVLKCLQNLSSYHRSKLDIPVIGITGSNGKTTTKELVYAVLNEKYKVHATVGNFNNHLGVPLTLLSAPLDTEILIVEMGANHKGDIEELCQIANPNFGLITNIGYAHIEGFGSYDGVIETKTELYKHIKKVAGVIFCHSNDDVLVRNLPENLEIVNYPNNKLEISEDGLGLKLNFGDFNLHSSLYGIYNATNIHAAFAVGSRFGISPEKILDAVNKYKPNMNRSQIMNIGSTTFILDAYNANPSSMKLSIQSFSQLKTKLNKILILGDMKELGDNELMFHMEIVEMVLKSSWDYIFTVGDIFSKIKEDRTKSYENVESLINYLNIDKDIFDNSIVLLKASRSIKLETIIKNCFDEEQID